MEYIHTIIRRVLLAPFIAVGNGFAQGERRWKKVIFPAIASYCYAIPQGKDQYTKYYMEN